MTLGCKLLTLISKLEAANSFTYAVAQAIKYDMESMTVEELEREAE